MEPKAFYSLLEGELDAGAPHLDAAAREAFLHYYRRLAERPRRRPFYRYNWTRRLAPAWDALRAAAAGRELRVLDAGCGCGTESIFWAGLGGNVSVIGADSHAGRLAAARGRLPYYAERLGPLRAEFLNEDVFRLLSAGLYDLVWVMEAISHIDPAEEFLRRACEALAPGGWLAVTDSNLLNPAMALKVWKLRRAGASGTTMRTETGTVVCSAPEQLISARRLARLLRGLGLEVVGPRLHVFFPPCLASVPPLFGLARIWDRAAGATPLLRHLGGIYTVLARRS
jgi:2-polyprenyl-3-methyl-5-hydroxy-6-metoxy-1,4-benzoquinol methylase